MSPRLRLSAAVPTRSWVRALVAWSSVAIALLTVAAGTAATADADTTSSSNWSGYAVHRAGTRFNRVVGAWVQPRPHCVKGNQTYSAAWVGLGGFAGTANALEQIGSESDCSASGAIQSSAWFELVPAPSRTIKLRVRPGDALVATVSATGHQVSLSLADNTTHHSFHTTIRAATVDVSSAEWIVEAPSECVTAGECQTLPLADFGSIPFSRVSARTVGGRLGGVSSRFWGFTQIRLVPDFGEGGQEFVVYAGSGLAAGTATPSAVSSGGNSFNVSFGTLVVPGVRFEARRASVLTGRIVHPRR